MAEPDLPGPGIRVLLVDDEVPIRRFLRSSLASRGCEVAEAGSLAEARLLVSGRPPDLILLDLGLPDGCGIDLVREIRGWSSLPIVVLSARGEESDKVAALDAGADDYLTKPFGVPELLARLRVALRHARRGTGSGAEEPVWRWSCGDRCGLRVDAARRQCWRAAGDGEHEVRLTPTEFRLLLCLARDHGKVLTHRHLLRAVWGPQHDGDVAYLRVFMGQLRQKIEVEPARPRWLLTEPGVGYRMAGADESGPD